jgi:hypothetical protein
LTSSIVPAALLGIALAAATSVNAAGKLDLSKNMICATVDIVACVDHGVCAEGQARDFDLPQFVVVDLGQKLIRATDESGQKEVSPIKNREDSSGELVLQGAENGRGWSIAINRDNGDMAATLAGKDVSFIVFGVCTSI